jgi:hypothetical protein
MGETTKTLATQIKSAAEAMVGKKAVAGSKKMGFDCYALVNKLLLDLGANTPKDYGAVTPTADYEWGDEIFLSDLKPGDILQFRNHVVKTTTTKQTAQGEKWDEQTRVRPHHTAIVVAVNKDGSVIVIEQNVKPNPKKVSKNKIDLLSGSDVRKSKGQTIEITVTGTVKAYRAVRSTKGASLLPRDRGGLNERARMRGHIPAEGGPTRTRRPVGLA